MRLDVRRARRARAGYALVVALVAAAAGCRVSGIGLPGPPLPPEQAIRVTPANGAKGVRSWAPVEVSVTDGRLERVRVVRVGGVRGRPLAGRISLNGLRWRPSGDAGLELAGKYSVDAVAVDGHGRRIARHTSFTTFVPEHRFMSFFRPEHGSVVGTGMIVSFDFDRPIADRAAVERGIRITARPPVKVAGHWFGNRRLDFRPRTYWRAGTEVSVRLRLRGVKAAPGAYGIQHKTVRFTIGRSQVSTVDAAAYTMTVRRDGRELATLPITAGAPHTPTYSGKMVVMARHDVTRMDGATVGFGGEYDIPDVPHAMRLTTSGTFLHGNYWTPRGTFGAANVSHGCIGLHDVQGGRALTPARWFYDSSIVGDVVEVVHSADRTVAPYNGLGGWNLSWDQWRAGSALR
ncbi:Ig-like domain-containing protein [Streptomyces sp. 8N616]|uniref:Ig-like domain-containing protein n=1 Tax=Streptomyces sp. 8N616 TaxID=3457414 RepID=UPI003FD03C84